MKAARATVELSALAAVYLACGGVALALAAGEADVGTTAAVFAGLSVIAVGAVVAWIVRVLRNPSPLPAHARIRTVVVTSGTVIGASPAALIVWICSNPSSTSWLAASACLVVGAVHLLTAALAARVERRTGVRVLRSENRYFLAH